jgi:transcription elongation factor GreA
MTAPLALTPSARAALTARLDGLLAQHAQAQAESAPPTGPGDAADRTGNIEALIRLADLESRIAALQLQLEAPECQQGAPHSAVEVGDRVVVRFSGEPEAESYLVGFVEQAGPGIDVITPASPFGKALIGKRPGDVVQFRAAGGAHLSATLVDIAA